MSDLPVGALDCSQTSTIDFLRMNNHLHLELLLILALTGAHAAGVEVQA